MPVHAIDDQQDWIEASAVVLEDVDRLLGSSFSGRFSEAYDPGDLNRTWQPEEDDDQDQAAEA